MSSPYINTKLFTTVMLHPHQMNNKIYINLKKNLEGSVVKRCFSRFGFIDKIIEILDYKKGVIDAENMEGSASFDLAFSTKLCAPKKNVPYIFQIERVNKLLITAINGPIIAIITNDRINDSIFFKDNNDNIRYKTDNQSTILQPKDYIKITLHSIQFHHGDTKIKAIGFIDNMATDEEKEKFYSDEFADPTTQIDYETYMVDPVTHSEAVGDEV